MKRYVVFTPEYQTVGSSWSAPEWGQDSAIVEAKNKNLAKSAALRKFRSQSKSYVKYLDDNECPFKGITVLEVLEEKEILKLTSEILNEYCFNMYDRTFPHINFQAGSMFSDLFEDICFKVEDKSGKCLVETNAIQNLLQLRSGSLTEIIDLVLDDHTISVLSIQANDRGLTLNEWINLILMKFCEGIEK